MQVASGIWLYQQLTYHGKIGWWTLFECGFCHKPLKKFVCAKRHYRIMVIFSRTLPSLLYLILLETNTIDHPTLTVLILSSSIGSCTETKRCWRRLQHSLLAVLADLHETLDPAVDGCGHDLRLSHRQARAVAPPRPCPASWIPASQMAPQVSG